MTLNGKAKGVIIAITIITLLVGYDIYRKNSLEKFDEYSIAKIQEKREGKGSNFIVYYYFIDGERFESSFDTKRFARNHSLFYKVRYSSRQPSWSEILLNRPVMDRIAIKAAGFSLPTTKRNQFKAK